MFFMELRVPFWSGKISLLASARVFSGRRLNFQNHVDKRILFAYPKISKKRKLHGFLCQVLKGKGGGTGWTATIVDINQYMITVNDADASACSGYFTGLDLFRPCPIN